MSVQKAIHLPNGKLATFPRGVRSQYGALCYRRDKGKLRILLITSRGSGRWIVPKGWPMPGRTPAAAAAQEAYEEAGVEGRLLDVCIGVFGYDKLLDDKKIVRCAVAVFPIKVKRLLKTYPERGQRVRKWFTPKRAAQIVDEKDLRDIIRGFDPHGLS